jgi:hypothetical protein
MEVVTEAAKVDGAAFDELSGSFRGALIRPADAGYTTSTAGSGTARSTGSRR